MGLAQQKRMQLREKLQWKFTKLSKSAPEEISSDAALLQKRARGLNPESEPNSNDATA